MSDRLPIKIDSTSNGEFRPVPLSPALRAARRLAQERNDAHARRTGASRRDFLVGLCGAATTLLAYQEVFAATGAGGGGFVLPKEAAFEPAAAAQTLSGREFIFDVQTHMVDVNGAWRQRQGAQQWQRALAGMPQGSCGESDPVACFSADRFIKEVFVDSDTQIAVLSFVPGLPEDNPLTAEEARRTRELVAKLKGMDRLLLHAPVVPNAPGEIDRMATMARTYPVAAWKVYTQWGPQGTGWRLDDPRVGIPFIEQARALGIKNIAIHKGLPFASMPKEFATCADVGPAARMFPDVNFIIYHSGFETDRREGPYNPANAERGIDSLVKSLQDNGIGPGRNVYAELGSTWRFLMRDPEAAAHGVGKLLRHVGEDNVLWGTDSIWYGSPQDQIQAFRAFQISDALVQKHGYPALTPALKAKIFGLSGAAVYGVSPEVVRQRAGLDRIGRLRAAYREAPAPSFQTYGPVTAAEFDALLQDRGGLP
ncbi:MAG TPA: amidohydrolase family protein, partial [Alphaproteobacteria bacterium]|nr:amidohydrolase family protein [Alphaproteobacteria bacterium]